MSTTAMRRQRSSTVSESDQLEVRRVKARMGATGVDISQRYDAFGQDHVSTANNQWAAFFGSPAHSWKTASYDKYDRHNYSLPEAYEGENKQIGQTIDELIYTEETFYTTELLPFVFTDQVSVAWDKYTFNEHFTGIVPEQGISRLVSSTRESRTESFMRHGLAAIFEHGFMDTEQGRANYFLTLNQIARAVRETTNFGVIYAYLTCGDYRKQWEASHGYFRKNSLAQILERENFMWAIAIKSKHGMVKLDAQITEWMNDYRAEADTWVMPPKPAIYLRLVPAENVDYYLAGPEGPNRVNNVVGAGRPHESNSKRVHDIVEPVGIFKKNKVFLTRSYHVDKKGPIDLMSQMSSLGEFFKIVKGTASCDYRNGYESCMSDTRIYNEDDDCGFTVSKGGCVKYTQVFDETGKPRSIINNVNPEDAKDLDGVFFLRRVTDPVSQQEKYVPIEYLGDVDPEYFGTNDAANLAYAAIARALPDLAQRKQVQAHLTTGMREIDRLAKTPLTAATLTELPLAVDGTVLTYAQLAGHTTWAAVMAMSERSDLVGGLGEIMLNFVRAVQTVTSEIGPLMGASGNMFLDPQNAIPIEGYGERTAERSLYENLLNYRQVPVFKLTDDRNDQGEYVLTANAGMRDAYDLAVGGFLDPTVPVDAQTIAARNLSENEKAQLRADRTKFAATPASMEAYNQVRTSLLAHPTWTRASDENYQVNMAKLKVYIESLDAAIQSAREATKGQVGLTQKTRTFQGTMLAVNPANKSVVDGSARLNLNLALASKFDLTRPRDLTETAIRDEDGLAQSVPILIGMQVEDVPLFRGLIGAQTANEQVGAPSNMGSYGGYENQYEMADNAPLDNYYDAEPVGMMAEFGADDRRVAREEHRKWIPAAGSQVGLEAVNTRFGTLGYNLDLLAKSTVDPLAKLTAALYYGSTWTLQTLEGFEHSNIPGPFGILGFRVGRYNMALGIKCKRGLETGASYYGNSRFMLADDAALMIHYGNFTHYGKAVVNKPENVFIARNIFPNRALGGMGVTPYTSVDQFKPEDNQMLGDIFYVMIPYTETNFPKVMSMAGRFYTYMDAGMLDEEDPANRALHYSTAPYYNRFWGWYSPQEVVVELDDPMYYMDAPGFRTEVWQGAQGTYNKGSKKFDCDIIRNKSPWGVTAEGCRACRNGEMDPMPVVPHGQLGF